MFGTFLVALEVCGRKRQNKSDGEQRVTEKAGKPEEKEMKNNNQLAPFLYNTFFVIPQQSAKQWGRDEPNAEKGNCPRPLCSFKRSCLPLEIPHGVTWADRQTDGGECSERERPRKRGEGGKGGSSEKEVGIAKGEGWRNLKKNVKRK